MRFAFLTVAFLGFLYISCMPRRIDLFTCAYFAALVYFMPGLFGVVRPPDPYGLDMVEAVHATTYVIMLLVLTGITIGAVASDWVIPARQSASPASSLLPIHWVALALTLVSFAAVLATTGRALLVPNKAEWMAALNRWYILAMISAAVLAVYSFIARRWLPFVLAMCLLLFDVYMGRRSNFVIAVGAIGLVWAREHGNVRLIPDKLGYMLAAFALTWIMFIYKRIYVTVKLGRWDIVGERLTSWEFYVESIRHSEPSGTQAILNRVVAANYQSDLSQLYNLIYHFVLFAESAADDTAALGTIFDPQSALFPGLGYGIASNVWAQMWSMGGISTVVIFVCIFVLVIIVLARGTRAYGQTSAGILSLCGMVWVFYIHRNNISYELGLLRRYLLVFGLCWVVAAVLNAAGSKGASNARRVGDGPRGPFGLAEFSRRGIHGGRGGAQTSRGPYSDRGMTSKRNEGEWRHPQP